MIRGFPPVFTSLTMFVLSPMAAIAQMMKNLDRSFIGVKNDEGTPMDVATVVIIEAAMK